MSFKTYALSEEKLIKIARLCVQEQGSVAGVRAEASQGANLLETNSKYSRFGDDIYSFFRNSRWYYESEYYMDHGSASSAAIEAVRDVLCKGERVFPQYVDEHDCIKDIEWVKTDGKYVEKSDRSNYVKGKTVIHNKMGSTYTFYAFPAPGCDPFGYTKAAYDYVMGHGGSDEPISDNDGRVAVSATLPELYKDCPKGSAVRLWRQIIGMKSSYDIFNAAVKKNTKIWQSEHGLKADGIVGKNTWAAALNSLK